MRSRCTLGTFLTTLVVSACSTGQANGDSGTSGSAPSDAPAIAAVRAAAIPITGAATDYDTLMALARNARVVFLGEQTHGTHEFYRERARITQRLIRDHGFRAIALEADWPEVERINRYIRGTGKDPGAEQSLLGFRDFPAWMWRNTDVRALVEWLRAHNALLAADQQVSIYGLDVYSLYESADAVTEYLASVDPAAAERARGQYACFGAHRPDPQRYGAAAASKSCQAQAEAVLATLRQRSAEPPANSAAAEALFGALRNAHAVANAEEYFRSLHLPGVSTWNVRDRRMEETLLAIDEHLAAGGRSPRIVVWAHNTHSGDARATELGEGGEHNVGQLIRQRLSGEALLVGFFTYRGTVMAASEWDVPARVFNLSPALPGAYSDLFHSARASNYLLNLRDPAIAKHLAGPRLERAVGVVYVPARERQAHYFLARLSSQFDVAVYFDETRALTEIR